MYMYIDGGELLILLSLFYLFFFNFLPVYSVQKNQNRHLPTQVSACTELLSWLLVIYFQYLPLYLVIRIRTTDQVVCKLQHSRYGVT